MLALDYDRLRATDVAGDPFPHIVVPGFVRPPSLTRVLADLPPLAGRGSFPVAGLRLGPAAAALVEELAGPRFRAAVATRFGLDLSSAPTMMTLRGRTDARDGHIHCDSTAKLVTVLLYLNQGGPEFESHQGCLRLLRGPRDLEDYAVEVPPVNGALLVFPNGPATWHGHKTFVGPRTSIQLNYMTTDARARSELRRHRLSAFLKRLTQAA